jgi:hypothetical protein
MTGRSEKAYFTLRLQYADREATEGFADIAQAASWTVVHHPGATWESLVPEEHATVEDVLEQLGGDHAAGARFLARCGESDEAILARFGGTSVDLRTVLARARDELSVLAEHADA